jgi:flagellar motility protein MotE (MotC chaperone)
MAKHNKKSKKRGFRLIPITVTMLALLFAIKVNDLYIGSRELQEFYGVREARAMAPPEKKEEKPEEAAPKNRTEGEKDAKPEAEEKKGDKSKEVPGETITYGTGRTKIEDIEEMKKRLETPRFTQNEIDLLQNLSKRREEIDQREKELDLKVKVLDASEKQINDKIVEMKALQAELEKLLTVYNEKENTQIKSLVKIYENMKPGDAANIFNEMQMSILLEVIDKMSERKVAPVLAAMDPKKARDVTQELAAMRKSITEKAPGAAGAAPNAAPRP